MSQLHRIHAAVDAKGVNTVSFCRAKPWKELQPRGVSLAKIKKELRSVLATSYLEEIKKLSKKRKRDDGNHHRPNTRKK